MEPEQQQRILGFFLEEAQEHLETLRIGLAELPFAVLDDERITELFRAAHSVKGGAAMLGYEGLRSVAYGLEDSLKLLKDHPDRLNSQVEQLLQEGFWGFEVLLGKLEQARELPDEVSAPILVRTEPAFVSLKGVLHQPSKAAAVPVALVPIDAVPAVLADVNADALDLTGDLNSFDFGDLGGDLAGDLASDLSELDGLAASAPGGSADEDFASLFGDNAFGSDGVDGFDINVDLGAIDLGGGASQASDLTSDFDNLFGDSLFGADALADALPSDLDDIGLGSTLAPEAALPNAQAIRSAANPAANGMPSSTEADALIGLFDATATAAPSIESGSFDDLFGASSLADAQGEPPSLADLLGGIQANADRLGELAGGVESASDAELSSELDALFAAEAVSAPAARATLPADDSFADLESLLAPPGAATGPDEFSDLESLLGAPAPAAPAAAPTPEDAAFADMEQMLLQAEASGGGRPAAAPSQASRPRPGASGRTEQPPIRVPVKILNNLNNLVGEMVVNRNLLKGDQERLRQSLERLLQHTQQLSDVGQRLQDLYERSLLENALANSRSRTSVQPTNLGSLGLGSSSAGYSTGYGPSHDADDDGNIPSGVLQGFEDLEMDRFSGFHILSQEMIELIVRVKESTSDIDFLVNESLDKVARNFQQITQELQDGITRARMVAFSQTTDRLPRAVREISMKCGKSAKLHVEGSEELIDKMLVEQLHDPLTHLVNNAISHGIEMPNIRSASKKAPEGTIRVKAFHQGNQTIISVSDDGAGIDVEQVKRKAIQKGIVTAKDAPQMTNTQVYDLLFHPGFSTRDKADDFAGRGVGLDVVRTRLQELRGNVTIDSTLGKGTTFTIRLPLTLSISKALHCISNRSRIAFPSDSFEEMMEIPWEHMDRDEAGEPVIHWQDMVLPVQPLSQLLQYGRHMSRGNIYAGALDEEMAAILLLHSAGEYLAVQVDRFESEIEIVIKQLEGPVPKPVGIAGATVLGDGQVVPIVDVLELIDLAKNRNRENPNWRETTPIQPLRPEPVSDPLVLIIDDSITVREMLSMTFSKAGYRIEQARDGQEAWEKLRSGLPCNIIFCDIEMPRMTGLELLDRLQKDEVLKELPIAMLTSRGADRHRQMAAQLGANGYFTKPYQENSLLEAAARMLKGEVLLKADGGEVD
jgi:chemotaxis protein histidine kinase CheA/ActR/RegA family two-component response regulator